MHPDRQAFALNDTRGDRDASISSRGSTRGRGGGRGGARGASSASQGFPGAIPTGSISKLKAQLRQTKRLLARDDLTPDVRTTSERRIKTLEQELVKAEQSALEVKMVTKYRGVKFFERQKLLRKIKQAKRALESDPISTTQQTALLEARVDLYYVLRYPKTQKYISLFPDGTYISPTPPPAADTPPSDALAKRHALRSSIRKKVESGELPPAPEEGDVGIEGEEDVPLDESAAAGVKRGRSDSAEPPKVKKSKAAAAPPTVVATTPKTSAAAAPSPKPLPTPAPAQIEPPKPREGVRETKKEKKDKKDARRRALKAAKEAEAAGATAQGTAVEAAADADEGGEKPEGWAGEDDFFA